MREYFFQDIGPPVNIAKIKEEIESDHGSKAIYIEVPSTSTISEIDKHRANLEKVIKWSNATTIRSYGDLGYRCCYCTDQYKEPAQLKKHTIESHSDIQIAPLIKRLCMDRYFIKLDITALQCKICNQNIETTEDLLRHLKMYHQKNIHTDIKNHIIPFKFTTDTLQCFICMTKFSKFKMLQEHMHIHYRNYICDVCDLGYYNSFTLRCHKLTHSTGDFKCEYCSQVFDTKIKRKIHEKSKHLAKPVTYKCGYCSEVFTSARKKEIHLVSMHDLKVPTPKCESCDKVFPTRDKLHTHVKRVHLMEKPHKCLECSKSFFSVRELKNHMTKHTGTKVFNCDVCSKVYISANSLKEHMKIHNNMRPYRCNECGKTFVQKCSWKGHMVSKHGEIV